MYTAAVRNSSLQKLEEGIATSARRAHCLMVRSGTVALMIAVRHLATQQSRVFIPAVACPAVLSAVALAGLEGVLADIDLGSFAISLDSVEHSAPRAGDIIVPIHPYGMLCDMEGITTWGARHGLAVIEDACLAMGVKSNGVSAGNGGIVSILSFGNDKIIDMGGGGALLTDDPALDFAFRTFIDANPFFQLPSSFSLERLHLELDRLPENLAKRVEHAMVYHDLLSEACVIKPNTSRGFPLWRYTCRYRGDRSRLLQAAREAKVFISSHYHSLHHFYSGVDRPYADELSRSVINLPVKDGTSERQIRDTVEVIQRGY